jgi:hypothetical protein
MFFSSNLIVDLPGLPGKLLLPATGVSYWMY